MSGSASSWHVAVANLSIYLSIYPSIYLSIYLSTLPSLTLQALMILDIRMVSCMCPGMGGGTTRFLNVAQDPT